MSSRPTTSREGKCPSLHDAQRSLNRVFGNDRVVEAPLAGTRPGCAHSYAGQRSPETASGAERWVAVGQD